MNLPNFIHGVPRPPEGGEWLEKRDPRTEQPLSRFARSREADVAAALRAARAAQPAWASTPGVQRGELLHAACAALEARKNAIARIVAQETGKSLPDASSETEGAIALGRFFAGEGQRMYGRTMPSSVAGRTLLTLREPCGVAALITAANTPIANVAWKAFPALICGNACVLKSPEDAPATAFAFAEALHAAHLPPGLLNIVHGLGEEAGAPLVESPEVDIISFTGSSATGLRIAEAGAKRLAKVSLELGGKNPFVVCDDADLERAAHFAALSAFSNAGQRCASGSRIIVMESVYARFRALLIEETKKTECAPVLSARSLENLLSAIAEAKAAGATLLTGGARLPQPGYFLPPTLIENLPHDHSVAQRELFGPVATLHPARDYAEALALANATRYGLTACIHTRNIDRALHFTRHIRAGMAVVNAATYGSEPHMPFGGLGLSGNGTREPGTEALDIYSNLKSIHLNANADAL